MVPDCPDLPEHYEAIDRYLHELVAGQLVVDGQLDHYRSY
jgi:hypothetical protein